jgi:peptidoglycan/xylan/chitin deacetylase (PgdA/CDA1 family)
MAGYAALLLVALLLAFFAAPRTETALAVAPVASVRVPILMYHAVDARPIPGPYGPQLTITPKQLRSELAYLVGRGFHFVSLTQIWNRLNGTASLPSKPVALVFDDGYEDNYAVAFPILKQYGAKATFFVITDAVGKRGYMTWAELQRIRAAGMWIESHTVHHRDLTALSAASLRTELVGSRAALKAHLGIDSRFLGYPGGKYKPAIFRAVKSAGYVTALTTQSGVVLYKASPYEWHCRCITSFGLSTFARLL